MLGKSSLKGCIFMVLMYTWTRVYFVGFPCDIRMKISEIVTTFTHMLRITNEPSNHLSTHIEDKHCNIVTTSDTYVEEHWEQEDVVHN